MYSKIGVEDFSISEFPSKKNNVAVTCDRFKFENLKRVVAGVGAPTGKYADKAVIWLCFAGIIKSFTESTDKLRHHHGETEATKRC